MKIEGNYHINFSGSKVLVKKAAKNLSKQRSKVNKEIKIPEEEISILENALIRAEDPITLSYIQKQLVFLRKYMKLI